MTEWRCGSDRFWSIRKMCAECESRCFNSIWSNDYENHYEANLVMTMTQPLVAPTQGRHLSQYFYYFATPPVPKGQTVSAYDTVTVVLDLLFLMGGHSTAVLDRIYYDPRNANAIWITIQYGDSHYSGLLESGDDRMTITR